MNKTNFFEGAYTAPEIELYTAAVESGFTASLDGGNINDWQIDGDEVTC